MKGKITKMSSFIIFVYTRYWFTSSSLCNAASNDLILFKEISTFKRLDKSIYLSATAALLRHTWYLTEENITLALFSTEIQEDCRNQLAIRIGKQPFAEVEIRKPTLPVITTRSKLTDFVGHRSIQLFSLLGVDHNFYYRTTGVISRSFLLAQKL